MEENDIDIFGVCETWGKENYPPFRIFNYNCIFRNRGANGGGITMLIKKGISFSELDFEIREREMKDRFMGVVLSNNVTYICVYAPCEN